MAERGHQIHPIPPVYDSSSSILILGSFPSVKSRETGFFYGHPQNRYWRVLAAVFEDELPSGIPEKKAFLLRHGIAAWDVIASCDIEGSSDSSIRNAVPNDLSLILAAADIRRICANGRTAFKLYQKYMAPLLGRDCICLPSTSPANAAWSEERLIRAWRGALLVPEDP
ncbi:MAG: DNA-deoxyinosine glycosylase [Lachnospiraceae bacterium]|nr:DNA-deoxyinosine glycosylase [Lachnospiraceae bacterium]